MTSLYELRPIEVEMVMKAFVALRDGPWLVGEFHARTGIEPDEFAHIVHNWPDIRNGALVTRAVRTALLEVAKGIRFTDSEWAQWFSVSRDDYEALQVKVRTMTDKEKKRTFPT